ncbi:MAG: FAD-dependent oxidoreductase [Candidatus Marinimicrobia bacterium]|nr:FAD-dependent oxidoreductase [Candidatus Neomarinimicrobiota bacterium]MCF7828003.1 FAD-dependent oxidoreductase [Candidatus Neomarinimicrobiota bacterium]MCF7879242.1 FAD-dependent oxidoreductase [Candidatus Neomarinimicrobiota bacterium]
MRYHQVIVVGGGLAGLRAALELNKRNVKVAVVSKVHPLRSHSVEAQGGINAPLGNHPRGSHDSPELHAFDTVKGSDYLADQKSALRLTEDASERVREMEHWGVPFSRTTDGKIAQRPFGGAGFPRTCFASDKTGHVLLHTLYEQCVKYEQASERGEMVVYDEQIVTGLIVDDGVCHGVIVWDFQTGEIDVIKSEAVIFATGGAGRIFGKTTNALISTGLGMAIPYWAGIPIKDLEFVQFHPTTLFGTNILMTEGARGEGGFLLNNEGDRFLANYDDSSKAMEVAPRDIVARNMTREIMEGRGFEDEYLHLDLRHLGRDKILERLPGIRDLAMKFVHVDPIEAPVPVQPGMHYTMGGIDTNELGASRVPGFYAAGECGSVSVHGANRLGGNSMLETIVYGAIAGDSAAQYVLDGASGKTPDDTIFEDARKRELSRLDGMFTGAGEENPADIKDELEETMNRKCWVFREEKTLQEGIEKVEELLERYQNITLNSTGLRVNFDLLWALELGGNLAMAEVMIKGAARRKESRGSQFRTDFPTRDDDNWLHHTLAYYTNDGPRFDSSEVDLSIWEPKERKY